MKPTDLFSQHLKSFDGEIRRLQGVMQKNLTADVTLIAEMEDDYLVGGKRVRAIVTLLGGQLCALNRDDSDIVAAAIELTHTATLLHDDVVDDAPQRRHLPAASRVYGNAAAILAGDFLYSRASQLFASLGNIKLLQRVADVTNKLAEGEVLQLLHRGNPEMDEATYFSIINRKTANLFEMAATAAAILTDRDDSALAIYGHHLGVAFQLIDDCLDYDGQDQQTGKKIGTDFAEGKTTLPIILMLSRVSRKKRNALIEGWQHGQDDTFQEALQLVHDTGALQSTRARAKQEASVAIIALNGYPDSTARTGLINLADTSPYRSA